MEGGKVWYGGREGVYEDKEWSNDETDSKSGNKMCVTRREGVVCFLK